MATPFKRLRKNGEVTWRVILRASGWPCFCLTFEDYASAVDWLEEHEVYYFSCPENYFLWREKMYFAMRKKGLHSHEGILRMRFKVKDGIKDGKEEARSVLCGV
jgi:hypothetical protein